MTVNSLGYQLPHCPSPLCWSGTGSEFPGHRTNSDAPAQCDAGQEQRMSLGDIFWLFIMFSALQPWLRQQMRDAMRMRKIAQLERERDSRVILLVHRQETMRFLGFPIVRYIDVNDSEDVLRAIQMT